MKEICTEAHITVRTALYGCCYVSDGPSADDPVVERAVLPYMPCAFPYIYMCHLTVKLSCTTIYDDIELKFTRC